MAIEPDEPHTDATLAAELALGVLDGAERAAAQRRMLAEPAFAAEVEAWRGRLSPMFDDVADVDAPETLWPRIERALPAPGDTGAVVQLRRWRVATLVSTGLAASFAAIMIFAPGRAPLAPAPAASAPIMVAQLAPDSAAPVLLASWHAETATVRIAPAAMPTRGLTPELWLIPADGTPRSLGLIAIGQTNDVRVAPAHRSLVGDAVTLAVSLEPAGGSPTGLPTGPVVASGKLSPI